MSTELEEAKAEIERLQGILDRLCIGTTSPRIPRGEEKATVESLRETSDSLLKAARAHWTNYATCGRGAVVWTTSTHGELVLYSRGEYREQLMGVVDKLNNAPTINLRAVSGGDESFGSADGCGFARVRVTRIVRFCGPDWQNVHDRGKWWWSIGEDEDGYADKESSAYQAVAHALRDREMAAEGRDRCVEVSYRDGKQCPMPAVLEGRCLTHAGIHEYSHRTEEPARKQRVAGGRLACSCGSDATYVVGSMSEPAQSFCCEEHAKAWVSAVPLPRALTAVAQALGMSKEDARDWVERVPGVSLRKRWEKSEP